MNSISDSDESTLNIANKRKQNNICIVGISLFFLICLVAVLILVILI